MKPEGLVNYCKCHCQQIVFLFSEVTVFYSHSCFCRKGKSKNRGVRKYWENVSLMERESTITWHERQSCGHGYVSCTS